MASKSQSATEDTPLASPSESDPDSSEQQTVAQISFQTSNPADSSDSDEEGSSDKEDGEGAREENKNPWSEKSAQRKSESDSLGIDSDTDSSDSSPPPSESAIKIQLKNDVAKSPISAQNPNDYVSKSGNKKGKLTNRVGEEKKPPFTRLWSNDDELAIIQGMDEFRRETERDPFVDKDSFFQFLKKSLKFESSKLQLFDKIRKLKKKYHNTANKGESPVISKAHDLKLFEMSKKVWGGDSAKSGKRKAVNDERVGDSGSKRQNEKTKTNQDDFWDAYPCFKESIEIENSGCCAKVGMRALELSKFGAVKAQEMENKWMECYAKEMELKLLRSELVYEQTKLVLEVVKAAKP